MNDPRFTALAKQVVIYSTKVKEGDKVLLDISEIPDKMTIELIRCVRAQGATPFVKMMASKVTRELLTHATEEQFNTMAKLQMDELLAMDVFIAFRGGHNAFELSSVPPEDMKLAMKALKEVSEYRVGKMRWCILKWPTEGFAQQAKMSTEAFEELYFSSCTADYAAMLPAMEKLAELMRLTDRVRITGPGTDIFLSIKGMPAVACAGNANLPDGEVFSTPIKGSVNGTVRYNTPTVYQGTCFDEITLTVQDGKIVQAKAGAKTALLNNILDSDEGARYFGEFALGLNPHIKNAMCNILFDEKIAGSFHLTPGAAYGEGDDCNKSQIHWDLVCIQTPEYGGGEIYFDDVLIRQDGKFMLPELSDLNF